MCGIAGALALKDRATDLQRQVEAMLAAMRHRGPDDHGMWQEGPVCLGHLRLSIVDLSSLGHQPMFSPDGRYSLTYNGEIYNYRALRAELEQAGCQFRGNSDTEVLVNAFERWGLVETLQRAVGMFALALWDKKTSTLHLARDRAGEKPLYFGAIDNVLLFASELKALVAAAGHRPAIDRGALALYMKYNYVPGNETIYAGITKVEPGTFVSITPSGETTHTTWWSMDALDGRLDPPLDDADAISRFDVLLRKAISEQMVADVPLGAFLSGGIDSSLVVAYMQLLSSIPVKTFSIGFEEEAFNEAHHARDVAAHLGTEHEELIVTPRDALELVPKLSDIYCEPLADASQIPTLLLSAMTRKHVTVSLSGDGGDELFGGYHHYFSGLNVWSRSQGFPAPVRRLTGSIPEGLIKTLSTSGTTLKQKLLGETLRKAKAFFGAADIDHFYQQYSAATLADDVVLNAPRHNASLKFRPTPGGFGGDPLRAMMFNDSINFMVEDVLMKVDRAAMSVSLETRVPLLDRDIIEFSQSLPRDMLIRDGNNKWLLRETLYRLVPRALIDRPKMGFGVPMAGWLRGELRDWGESLLSHNRLSQQGYFNADVVRLRWQQHQDGKHDWSSLLWAALAFQCWLGD